MHSRIKEDMQSLCQRTCKSHLHKLRQQVAAGKQAHSSTQQLDTLPADATITSQLLPSAHKSILQHHA
jgi:hypothetical protein